MATTKPLNSEEMDGREIYTRRSSPRTEFLSQGPRGLTEYFLTVLEQQLRETLGYGTSPCGDYRRLLYYHMGWEDLGQPPCVPGKRIRSLLCLLSAAASGGDWHIALPFAASVELLHNFCLVHDDIQDRSPLRRGRATLWQVCGTAQAINAGDALFAHAQSALQHASDLPCETRLMALEILNNACFDLAQGQFLDLAFEHEPDVPVERYLAMAERKTGALLAAAAELGSLAADAPMEVRAHYRAFGMHLGLAFQIRDDVLDIWGDASSTGKATMTDIKRRKKTLPVIYGTSGSAAVRQAYDSQDGGCGDALSIVRLLEASHARTHAEAEGSRQAALALGHLANAHPQGVPGEALHALALNVLGLHQDRERARGQVFGHALSSGEDR